MIHSMTLCIGKEKTCRDVSSLWGTKCTVKLPVRMEYRICLRKKGRQRTFPQSYKWKALTSKWSSSTASWSRESPQLQHITEPLP